MTVKDFVKMEKSGAMFHVVDANRIGYLTKQEVEIVCDRNVLYERFAENEVVGFEPKTKRSIYLYVLL